ncbi:MAG: hypothetical protein IJ449_08065 [Clostridia bacterium]|nr:hypothetical protein [Clostridia bacterium]
MNHHQENETVRAFLETLSPDKEQLSRMETAVFSPVSGAARTSKTPKLRPKKLLPLVAALLTLTVGVTAVTAAPAIRKYFFPGVGVVSVDETADTAPLYMMPQTGVPDGADFTVLFGYWHDGAAELWITSRTQYEALPAEELFASADTVGELTLTQVSGRAENALQTYCIRWPSVTWEDALAGLSFAGTEICFRRVPSEYHPYTVENGTLSLTLIPLTEDLTTFAAELSYTDDTDNPLCLEDSSALYENRTPVMTLVDRDGNAYPLRAYGDSGIFSLTETPAAPITGFHAEVLIFAEEFTEETTVCLSLPTDGTAETVYQTVTYPDGMAHGMIEAVGYNHPTDPADNADTLQAEFPMGYVSFSVRALEQNGILYWSPMTYTAEYEAFLSDYTVMEEKSPYDTTAPDPMAPKTQISYAASGDTVYITMHHIPNGTGSVSLAAYCYTAVAPGSWEVTFTAAK